MKGNIGMGKFRCISIVWILMMGGFTGTLNIIPIIVTGYTHHDPIFVDGNSNFTSLASGEGWPGDGSEENPYIIQNYEIMGGNGHCIEIRNSTMSFVIKDSQIFDGMGGIYLFNTTNGEIKGCEIQNNQVGIFLEKSKEITVKKNILTSNFDGIYLFNSKQNIIENNNASQNFGEGVSLIISRENQISQNKFFDNQYALGLVQSNENIISYNTVSDNVGGIQIQNSHKNEVNWNSFSMNNIGVYIFNNCTENVISYNVISNNLGIGIILSKIKNNTFHHNNVINNLDQLQVTFSFNIWNDNNQMGNFWSDYTGSDENKDGIGDTNLPHQNVDNYPLMKPVEIVNDSKEEVSLLFYEPWSIILIMVIVAFILISFLGYKLGKRKKGTK
jgi:parallel beta-helix repeat protein